MTRYTCISKGFPRRAQRRPRSKALSKLHKTQSDVNRSPVPPPFSRSFGVMQFGSVNHFLILPFRLWRWQLLESDLTALTEQINDREIIFARRESGSNGSNDLIADTREDRLEEFLKKHPKSTHADIYRSADVPKGAFYEWKNNKLPDNSRITERIEDVLAGRRPLKKKPPRDWFIPYLGPPLVLDVLPHP
jgi:hypothetical protein